MANVIANHLVMARLCPYYMIQSVQNAHMVIPVYANLEEGIVDPFEAVWQACTLAANASTMATVEEALPGYSDAMSKSTSPAPTWLTTNRSGVYGQLYCDVLAALAAQQARAAAACVALQGQHPLPATALVALCTAQMEKGEPGLRMREMSLQEQQMSLGWCCKAWDAMLKEMTSTEPPEGIRDQGATVALIKYTLAARAAGEGETLAKRKELAHQYVSHASAPCGAGAGSSFSHVPPLKSWAMDGDPFLHLTAVCGHPDAPSSGVAAMNRFCEAADELGVAVLLEALPTQILPLYYAKWGFQMATWEGKSCTEATLNKQGWVLMWRQARPKADTASAATDEGEAEAPPHKNSLLERLTSVTWATGERAGARRLFTPNRKASRLEEFHLSTEAALAVSKRFVWHGKREAFRMCLPYSWATEYLSQCSAGIMEVPPYPPPTEPLTPWMPPPPTPAPSRSQAAVRFDTPLPVFQSSSSAEGRPEGGDAKRARTNEGSNGRAVSPPHRAFAPHQPSPQRPAAYALGPAGSIPGLGPHAVPMIYIGHFSGGTLHITWGGAGSAPTVTSTHTAPSRAPL